MSNEIVFESVDTAKLFLMNSCFYDEILCGREDDVVRYMFVNNCDVDVAADELGAWIRSNGFQRALDCHYRSIKDDLDKEYAPVAKEEVMPCPSAYIKERGIQLPVSMCARLSGYTRDGLSKMYYRDTEQFNKLVDGAWERFKGILCVRKDEDKKR